MLFTVSNNSCLCSPKTFPVFSLKWSGFRFGYIGYVYQTSRISAIQFLSSSNISSSSWSFHTADVRFVFFYPPLKKNIIAFSFHVMVQRWIDHLVICKKYSPLFPAIVVSHWKMDTKLATNKKQNEQVFSFLTQKHLLQF